MVGAELRAWACGDPVVVTLRGDLDVVDAASAAAAVLAATAGGQRVIVDLAALEFIDCCALGALARVQELARRVGGDVLLAAPQGSVLRLLDLTGLAGVFSIHASVAAAAAGLGSARYAPRRPVVGVAPLSVSLV
ncbi:MAG TPA: STAS domain-containing protein [Streptosporangiaceae bacterium]|jgi:anti-sigma B factor antagonist